MKRGSEGKRRRGEEAAGKAGEGRGDGQKSRWSRGRSQDRLRLLLTWPGLIRSRGRLLVPPMAYLVRFRVSRFVYYYYFTVVIIICFAGCCDGSQGCRMSCWCGHRCCGGYEHAGQHSFSHAVITTRFGFIIAVRRCSSRHITHHPDTMAGKNAREKKRKNFSSCSQLARFHSSFLCPATMLLGGQSCSNSCCCVSPSGSEREDRERERESQGNRKDVSYSELSLQIVQNHNAVPAAHRTTHKNHNKLIIIKQVIDRRQS